MLTTRFEAAKDWCYTGVGIMPNDADMRNYLAKNDYTYPIVMRNGWDSLTVFLPLFSKNKTLQASRPAA
jgi:mannitol 2-dehydrogenase